MAFVDPANDGIDVTAFPYDIEALHGRLAKYAYVVQLGIKPTTTVVVTNASNEQRTYVITTVMEQIPGFIKSIDTGTDAPRMRIFWDWR